MEVEYMNTITIKGKLTTDVEFIHNENKKAITFFTVLDNAGNKAIFWNCKVFGALAEKISSLDLKKKTEVEIFGQVQKVEYTDLEGKDRDGLEVVVEKLAPTLK